MGILSGVVKREASGGELRRISWADKNLN